MLRKTIRFQFLPKAEGSKKLNLPLSHSVTFETGSLERAKTGFKFTKYPPAETLPCSLARSRTLSRVFPVQNLFKETVGQIIDLVATLGMERMTYPRQEDHFGLG